MEPKSLRRPGMAKHEKRHSTERFRRGTPVVERWPNAKCAYVGFLWGRGKSCAEIERLLDDGSCTHTIRALVHRRWFLPADRPRGLIVSLNTYHVRKLEKLAAAKGMTVEQWATKVLASAVKDDLFAAIVDE